MQSKRIVSPGWFRCSTPLAYMPQLDGLRAVAVFLVLWTHTAARDPLAALTVGTGGVILFFVLSGFLITGILLQHKDAAPVPLLRSFYARRFLRIFPIYYLAIAVLVVANYAPAVNALPWHLFYLSNVAGASGMNLGYTTHFWSLSVEEQFYLLWPAVILFAPRRWLSVVIWSVIAMGPLWRLIGVVAGWPLVAQAYPLPGVVDALALGALLAYYADDNKARRWLAGIAAVLGVVLLGAALWAAVVQPDAPLYRIGSTLALALVSLALVDGAARGMYRILDWRPLRFVGRISYGVYLYHFPLMILLPRSLLMVAGVSVLVAALSWRYIEAPITNLKRHFPYSPPAIRTDRPLHANRFSPR